MGTVEVYIRRQKAPFFLPSKILKAMVEIPLSAMKMPGDERGFLSKE